MKKLTIIIALLCFSIAIASSIKDAKFYCNQGAEKFNKHDYKGAIQDSTKALELDPSLTQAYCNRAGANFNLKNYRNAINDYNKAIEINPENDNAYYGRGVARFMLGDNSHALNDLNMAKKLGNQPAIEALTIVKNKIDKNSQNKKTNASSKQNIVRDTTTNNVSPTEKKIANLIVESYNGNLEGVIFWINNGAAINGKANEFSPLMAAVQGERANPQVVRYLIKHGANVNATYKKWTTLHFTIPSKSPYVIEIIKILLDEGADRTIKATTEIGTPYEYAVLCKKYTIANVLENYRK